MKIPPLFRQMQPLARFSLLLALTLVISACSFSLAEDITPPPGAEQIPVSPTQPAAVSGPLYPLVPPNPEEGRAIFQEKCAPCHGSNGQGDGPRANQLPNPVAAIGTSEIARQASLVYWYNQVTRGNLERFMPPFPSLSDRQRWDVVAFAYTLSISPSTLERGAELYQANCAACHGDQGRGDGPQAVDLSTPSTNLADQAFMVDKTSIALFQSITSGVPPDMPAFGEQLSEDERWVLADYLRTLAFVPSGKPIAAETPAGLEDTPAAMETAAPTATAAIEAGTVTGNVTNGSGGELPEDLVVKLHGYDNMQAVITDTTTVQPDGSFIFQGVDMPADRVFLVTVEYDNTTYGSDIGVVPPDVHTIDLPVTVFESTTDPNIITVDRLHLFFEFLDTDTVRVVELYIMSNPTNRTLVPTGPGQPTVRFKLPIGSTNLAFEDGVLGGRYVPTPDGFGDTIAVRPGSGNYQVLFTFEMPYDRKLDIVQQVTIPVEAVVILVPEDGLKIRSDMLQDGGVRDVQGTQYHMYNADSLAPGEELRLTITGRASLAPWLTGTSSTSMAIGLGVFGFALLALGVFLIRRARSRAGGSEEPVSGAAAASSASQEDIDTLMDAILALDDQYQNGQLPEEAYRQRRTELRGHLKELMAGQRTTSP